MPNRIPEWQRQVPLDVHRTAPGWSRTLPGSVAESSKRATKVHGGLSQSNTTCTFPYVFMPDNSKEEEILMTQIVYAGRYAPTSASQHLQTLRQLNQLLREKQRLAMRIVSTGVQGGVENGFSAAQMKQLLSTPTSEWLDNSEFRTAMQKSRPMHWLAWLIPEYLLDTFNFAGFALSQVPDTEKKAVTLAVHGYIERAENVFGKDALPGHDLYITLTMYQNKKTSETYLQFVPSAESFVPTIASKLFRDCSGFLRHGYCQRVGSVLRTVREAPVSRCDRAEDAGLEEPSRSRSFLRTSDSAIICDFKFRRGLRTRWMC